jgi:hypothetical protein
MDKWRFSLCFCLLLLVDEIFHWTSWHLWRNRLSVSRWCSQIKEGDFFQNAIQYRIKRCHSHSSWSIVYWRDPVPIIFLWSVTWNFSVLLFRNAVEKWLHRSTEKKLVFNQPYNSYQRRIIYQELKKRFVWLLSLFIVSCLHNLSLMTPDWLNCELYFWFFGQFSKPNIHWECSH